MSADILPVSDGDAKHNEFTRLFTVNQRAIYLYIRSLVANGADVDELWQETNLVLWQRFADYRPGTNFLAWARRIAYNKVLNYRTRRRPPLQFSDDFFQKLAASDRVFDQHLPWLDALKRCAEKLTPTDRELIELRYSPNADCNMVAKALRRPIRSVYKAVGRIRSLLLECIRREIAKEDRK
ncbi:MAG: sigma-70 family RNA polymerase sigma factor [Pirellulales bacterium]|nr:sigma-70 family RNA polymerase sigma factor [Pirellulales bacterium]